MARSTHGPEDLEGFAAFTEEHMTMCGVGGMHLIEQGTDWVTWGFSDKATLARATSALMTLDLRSIEMRYHPGVYELYAAVLKRS